MRLYQAIVISLLGHGALLVPLTETSLPEIPVAPMQVSLSPAASPSNASRTAKADSASGSVQHVRENQDRDTADMPVAESPSESNQAIAVSHNKPEIQPAETSQAESRHTRTTAVIPVTQELREQISRHHAQPLVISRLKQKLQNYFEYPVLARRNGWEGKVVLAMDIYMDGRIYNIQLKTGSGYKILDRSALKAISKIQALPNLPGWQGNSPLNIHLPVIYRLQG